LEKTCKIVAVRLALQFRIIPHRRVFNIVNTSSIKIPWESLSSDDPAELFPALTSAQMERVAARGKTRKLSAGELLVAPDGQNPPFVAVLSGSSK
jgi:hypothetical protein